MVNVGWGEVTFLKRFFMKHLSEDAEYAVKYKSGV